MYPHSLLSSKDSSISLDSTKVVIFIDITKFLKSFFCKMVKKLLFVFEIYVLFVPEKRKRRL